MRELNLLLANAGIASKQADHVMLDQGNPPFLQSAQTILDNHSPYPACAVDTMSRIVMTNNAFERLMPGMSNHTAEQTIDDFFGSQRARDIIENWAEVAWAFIDRRQFEAVRSGDPHLFALSERALNHLQGVDRPPHSESTISMRMEVRFRIRDFSLKTYMTVLRYENVDQAALSGLRLQLFYPADQETTDILIKLDKDDYNSEL
jgi:hypothetical protein